MSAARYPLAERLAAEVLIEDNPISAWGALYTRVVGRAPSTPERRAAIAVLKQRENSFADPPPSASSLRLKVPELLAMTDLDAEPVGEAGTKTARVQK